MNICTRDDDPTFSRIYIFCLKTLSLMHISSTLHHSFYTHILTRYLAINTLTTPLLSLSRISSQTP